MAAAKPEIVFFEENRVINKHIFASTQAIVEISTANLYLWAQFSNWTSENMVQRNWKWKPAV